jgi:large subunit ribosomal protein L28
MSRVCEICGKSPLKANKVTFSNKHNRHRQLPNLQSIKTMIKGKVKRIKICTSCLKADKASRVY